LAGIGQPPLRPSAHLLISSSVIGVVSVRAASWMSIVPDSEGRMPSQIVSAALAAGVAQIAAVDAGKWANSVARSTAVSLRDFYVGIGTIVSIFTLGGLGYVHQLTGHEPCKPKPLRLFNSRNVSSPGSASG
jgi:hypothetical protein